MALVWNNLSSNEELEKIIENSKKENATGIVIFKHSTRCSISSMAKNRLERAWQAEIEVIPYYLDLLSNRNVSNKIQEIFDVEHQSPQLLYIKNGECKYHSSHSEISFDSLKEVISKN